MDMLHARLQTKSGHPVEVFSQVLEPGLLRTIEADCRGLRGYNKRQKEQEEAKRLVAAVYKQLCDGRPSQVVQGYASIIISHPSLAGFSLSYAFVFVYAELFSRTRFWPHLA